MKEAEFTFQITVRGVVTPEQWARLHRVNWTTEDESLAVLLADMAELFRSRLNARLVTIERVEISEPWEPT